MTIISSGSWYGRGQFFVSKKDIAESVDCAIGRVEGKSCNPPDAAYEPLVVALQHEIRVLHEPVALWHPLLLGLVLGRLHRATMDFTREVFTAWLKNRPVRPCSTWRETVVEIRRLMDDIAWARALGMWKGEIRCERTVSRLEAVVAASKRFGHTLETLPRLLPTPMPRVSFSLPRRGRVERQLELPVNDN